jgi:NADPH:quinone reductase-like Zn-dependent oxidoreductase
MTNIIIMKAIVFKKYGNIDVLKYETVDEPILSENQVLIRVEYASVNPVDWKVRNGTARVLTGLIRPKPAFQILGGDVAGEIEAVGSSVTDFQKGDKVCAILGGIPGGGYAEKVAVNVSQIALIPKSLDFKMAAALPLTGLTAFQAFKMADLQVNQNVLVNGASGGVGIFAVQIAKAMGAKVTAVCSQRNAEFILSLGADSVVDYEKEDFTKTMKTFDVIYDAVGNSSFKKCKSILSKSGTYITTIPQPISFLQSKLLPYFSPRRVIPILTKSSGEDLAALTNLVDKHQILIPIDAEFPLKNAAAAHDYSQTGRVKGKLVLRM